MTEYEIPEEPNNFVNFIIPILLMLIVSSILYFGNFHETFKDGHFDHIISVGKMNRVAAQKFCQKRNLKLPLPIAIDDTIETLPSYWIRVQDVSSQWVDSETLTQVWFQFHLF